METVTTFLVFGGIAFWAVTILTFLAMLVAIEWENGFWATGFLIAWLGSIHIWGDINVVQWIVENQLLTAGFVVGYFVVGTAWCYSKWYFWLKKKFARSVELYRANRLNFEHTSERFEKVKANHATFVDPTNKHDPSDEDVVRENRYWEQSVSDMAREEQNWGAMKEKLSSPPQVADNKAQIIRWMTFWPISGLWTLINDPIRQAFIKIYDRISGRLQRMSDRIFDDMKLLVVDA